MHSNDSQEQHERPPIKNNLRIDKTLLKPNGFNIDDLPSPKNVEMYSLHPNTPEQIAELVTERENAGIDFIYHYTYEYAVVTHSHKHNSFFYNRNSTFPLSSSVWY